MRERRVFRPCSCACNERGQNGHMLFGMTGRQCRTTIAAGRVLMLDGKLQGIDEEAENAHILEQAKRLWGDLNHRTY